MDEDLWVDGAKHFVREIITADSWKAEVAHSDFSNLALLVPKEVEHFTVQGHQPPDRLES